MSKVKPSSDGGGQRYIARSIDDLMHAIQYQPRDVVIVVGF